MNKDTILVYV